MPFLLLHCKAAGLVKDEPAQSETRTFFRLSGASLPRRKKPKKETSEESNSTNLRAKSAVGMRSCRYKISPSHAEELLQEIGDGVPQVFQEFIFQQRQRESPCMDLQNRRSLCTMHSFTTRPVIIDYVLITMQ